MIPPPPLGGMEPAAFLERFWQRRPLLVRRAIPDLRPPATAGELAGLACERDVESRLVVETDDARRWHVRHGPLEPRELGELPERGWTLLVHGLDRVLPAAARLLDRFRFLPNWRIDDVMASHAAPGGSVGPHVDDYDVFLVQGSGRKRWRVGSDPVGDEALADHPDLRLLASFEPDREWIVEPGDLLYLPPRLPHHGVALDAGTTLSIGLRAPSHRELACGLLSEIAATVDPRRRLEDADRLPQDEPGEITAACLRRAGSVLRAMCEDGDGLARWFGRFVTEPRRVGDEAPPQPPWSREEILRRIEAGEALERSAVSCFAHVHRPGGGTTLFVGGVEYGVDGPRRELAVLLTGARRLDHDALAPYLADPHGLDLVMALVERGFLAPLAGDGPDAER